MHWPELAADGADEGVRVGILALVRAHRAVDGLQALAHAADVLEDEAPGVRDGGLAPRLAEPLHYVT